MSCIELLAGELFVVQRDSTDDPVLREIFETFIEDERRHSEVALRLAAHYDVRKLREYRLNPHLEAFAPRFLEVMRHVSPDIGNVYITCGELLLDIALLRSLNDFVDDPTCAQAMQRINRDESRHIAVDYHMLEYYGSPEYAAIERARATGSVLQRLRAAWVTAMFVWSAGPFLRDVFFAPMDLVDPSGRRLLEAFKRIQLIGRRPAVEHRPFTRFTATMQAIYESPLAGRVLAPGVARIMGLDPRVIGKLYTEAEAERVRTMDTTELAEEAISVKEGAKGQFDLDARVWKRRADDRVWTDRVVTPLARLRGWVQHRADRSRVRPTHPARTEA
jgi:hypothetical protein